jgi:hypothetical protein
MTFLEELTAHKGGLILLKTELYWYDGRGWDGITGRVCLLMDADDRLASRAAVTATAATAATATATALLLIDGRPHWVWVSRADVELLQPVCNPPPAVV